MIIVAKNSISEKLVGKKVTVRHWHVGNRREMTATGTLLGIDEKLLYVQLGEGMMAKEVCVPMETVIDVTVHRDE